MKDSQNREVEVFSEAVELPTEKRAELLERACGGDVKLRQRVESLLQIHDRAGDFWGTHHKKRGLNPKREL